MSQRSAPPLIALERCPACGAERAEEFSLGEAELRRCAACGTVYSQRYADPDAVYVDGYYSGATQFGIDVRHPRFQAYLREVNAQRAALLQRALGRPGRALDVGCGTGDFLVALRERGWTVAGVDPIAESGEVARGRGLDVRTALLEESGVPAGDWDVVSALHVLEHVPDARAFLSLLARWARPGGHVLVEAPNWASRLRRRSGERWVHLRPLEHLVHWTPATLEGAVRRAGLQPVAIRTPTYRCSLHTLDQALSDVARSHWGRVLARMPAPAARAVVGAARALDARRGEGMVVWGLARVPDGR